MNEPVPVPDCSSVLNYNVLWNSGTGSGTGSFTIYLHFMSTYPQFYSFEVSTQLEQDNLMDALNAAKKIPDQQARINQLRQCLMSPQNDVPMSKLIAAEFSDSENLSFAYSMITRKQTQVKDWMGAFETAQLIPDKEIQFTEFRLMVGNSGDLNIKIKAARHLPPNDRFKQNLAARLMDQEKCDLAFSLNRLDVDDALETPARLAEADYYERQDRNLFEMAFNRCKTWD